MTYHKLTIYSEHSMSKWTAYLQLITDTIITITVSVNKRKCGNPIVAGLLNLTNGYMIVWADPEFNYIKHPFSWYTVLGTHTLQNFASIVRLTCNVRLSCVRTLFVFRFRVSFHRTSSNISASSIYIVYQFICLKINFVRADLCLLSDL